MKWIEPTEISDEVNVELKDYNPLLRKLMFSRGIRTRNDAEVFLHSKLEQLADPFLLFDIARAVKRIEEAIKKNERIFIHGDFDVDGICATAILWEYLYRNRKARVLPFIPSRADDGYGMSESSVTSVIKEGADLIISVDCGIRDVEVVKKFRRSQKNKDGVDFIITDHHQAGEKLPRYVPVVHPAHPRGEYPFRELSGAAVAWKLVAAMEKTRNPDGFDWRKIPGIDFVAFSTVCDVMPLTGENRILVKYGLEVMRNSRRVGMKALAEDAGIILPDIKAYHFGYILGPRINAAGRIGDAMDAVRLLTTQKESSAKFLANKLGGWNRERQEITEVILKEVREKIERGGTGKHLYFAHGNDWPEGIIGLVAGKIQDEFNHPVVLVSRKDGASRGSARSISGFDMMDAIERQKELLESYGGHTQAAGFTVESKNIEELKTRLETWAEKKLKAENFVRQITADVKTTPGELTWDVWHLIREVEPFGYGNRKPVFWVKNAVITELRGVGDNKHLKFVVKGESGRLLNCIFFGGGDWLDKLVAGNMIDMMGGLDVNKWNGNETLQLNVMDLEIV